MLSLQLVLALGIRPKPGKIRMRFRTRARSNVVVTSVPIHELRDTLWDGGLRAVAGQ